jgi:hypothetical protein
MLNLINRFTSYRHFGFNILIVVSFYLITWLFGSITFYTIDKWQTIVVAVLIFLDVWAIFYKAIIIKHQQQKGLFRTKFASSLFIFFYICIAFFRIFITGFLVDKVSVHFQILDDYRPYIIIGKEVIILILLFSVSKVKLKPAKWADKLSGVIIFLFTVICFIIITDSFANLHQHLRKTLEVSYVDIRKGIGNIIVSSAINIFFATACYLATHFVLVFLRFSKTKKKMGTYVNLISMAIILYIILKPTYYDSLAVAETLDNKIEEAKTTKYLDCSQCRLGFLGYSFYNNEDMANHLIPIKDLSDAEAIDLSDNNIYPMYFTTRYKENYGYHVIDTLLQSFHKMPHLKDLSLGGNFIDYRDFKPLIENATFNKLEVLDLSYTKKILEYDSLDLSNVFPQLKILYFKQYKAISDHAIHRISAIQTLEKIYFRKNTISEFQKQYLMTKNPAVQIIVENL